LTRFTSVILLFVVLALAAATGAQLSNKINTQLANQIPSSSELFEPPSYSLALPDFSNFQNVQEKKQAFFAYLLPIVQQVNFEVERERKRLLSAPETAPIDDLCSLYKANCGANFEANVITLLQHIDTLPPSMVVAQAANESAWGTSRFATQGNNLFGEWCFTKGCGIVPRHRNNQQQHEVRRFDSPLQSVRSYVHNINASHAYAELRAQREQIKNQGVQVRGLALAEGLHNYSIRGDAYVKEIQAMIRQNNLDELDAG